MEDSNLSLDNDDIIAMDARNVHFKLWPMWDAWKEIFGKDRAVETTTADLLEMSNEVRSNGIPNLESGGSEYVASTDAPSGAIPHNNKSFPQGLDQSVSDSEHKTQPAKKKNKKRKIVDRAYPIQLNQLMMAVAYADNDFSDSGASSRRRSTTGCRRGGKGYVNETITAVLCRRQSNQQGRLVELVQLAVPTKRSKQMCRGDVAAAPVVDDGELTFEF
ncbi:hypothetical protein SASPL_137771 [Salvia splendens]|uniref:Uncharacterized protein n=1 Tax=Salvia splendens TaxID=180675 RepID=A0A8X8WTZ1_SALSN|nr:hypothetical protein SASPL_137771 [Salvia splendens]